MSDEITPEIEAFGLSNIAELLPKNDQDYKITFIAVGPKLLDALLKGMDITSAANEAGIAVGDAIKLLATPEFNRLKEAYLSIGDLESKEVRIRIAKSILAAQIAAGVTFRKREPMDILEYVRRELDVKRGESSVNVYIKNDIVPRPYQTKNVGVGEEGSSLETLTPLSSDTSSLPQPIREGGEPEQNKQEEK